MLQIGTKLTRICAKIAEFVEIVGQIKPVYMYMYIYDPFSKILLNIRILEQQLKCYSPLIHFRLLKRFSGSYSGTTKMKSTQTLIWNWEWPPFSLKIQNMFFHIPTKKSQQYYAVIHKKRNNSKNTIIIMQPYANIVNKDILHDYFVWLCV